MKVKQKVCKSMNSRVVTYYILEDRKGGTPNVNIGDIVRLTTLS